MNDRPLVSIITPCYNSEKYISKTIESVQTQTYLNWEMLIVDDCSSDRSSEIIRQYCEKDIRIKHLKTNQGSGSPTTPRNLGIVNALGRYIAFLDSDDLWLETKLEKQLEVFQKNDNAAIVFSYYTKISEDGICSGGVVSSPKRVTYNKLLYGNSIGCLTGMYDTQKVGKIYMRHIGHEDYAMWLEILKKGFIGVNTCDVQALYRVRSSSVSANKLKAMRWQWNIYVNQENLNYFKAGLCFLCYSIKALIKIII